MNDFLHVDDSHNCHACGKLILKIHRPSGVEETGCICDSDDTENLFLDLRDELGNIKTTED